MITKPFSNNHTISSFKFGTDFYLRRVFCATKCTFNVWSANVKLNVRAPFLMAIFFVKKEPEKMNNFLAKKTFWQVFDDEEFPLYVCCLLIRQSLKVAFTRISTHGYISITLLSIPTHPLVSLSDNCSSILQPASPPQKNVSDMTFSIIDKRFFLRTY